MKQRLTVIFDTNSLFRNRNPQSAEWLEFRTVHSNYQCTVKIPYVVAHELAALRSQEIHESAKEIDKAGATIERCIKQANSNLAALRREKIAPFNSKAFLQTLEHRKKNTTTHEDSASYQFEHLEQFVGNPVTPIDWPSKSHQEVVSRCSQMKAPFTYEKGKDKGYKDYLLWLCVLDQLQAGDETTVLITDDKAFRSETGELHTDLQGDLAELSIPPARLTIVTSLDEFNSRFTRPFNERDLEYERDLRKSWYLQLSSELERFGEDFDEVLMEKVRVFNRIPNNLTRDTNVRIIQFVPVLSEVKEVRTLPGNSRLLLMMITSRYYTEVCRTYANILETERHWVGFECACEVSIGKDNTVLAATLDADSAVLCDLADCRVTVSKDVKGNSVEVAASMPLAGTKTSLQHFESMDIVSRILKDFGWGQFACRLVVDTPEQKKYEFANVPTSVLAKWKFTVPTFSAI
jgi:hypothetical protein